MPNKTAKVPEIADLMSGEELSDALRLLRWSRADLAAELHCSRSMVCDWCTGPHKDRAWRVPAAVATWLRERVDAARRHPAPSGWRTASLLRSAAE